MSLPLLTFIAMMRPTVTGVTRKVVSKDGNSKRSSQARKCKVVFFDLEFYVPAEKRTASSFCYNPWDKDCRFIGGSFLVANPERDFNIAKSEVLKKTKSFWLWEHPTEKEMLERIYALLKTACDPVKNAHDGAVSAILCGIGITSSDVPILFELFKRFHILSNQEAFAFQNSFRVVDLSQLVIGTFNNPATFYIQNPNTIF